MSPEHKFETLANPGVRLLHPYEPGQSMEKVRRELGLDRIIKLASNENPLGPSPLAVAAMAEAGAGVGRYPDGHGFALRTRLAEVHGVAREQITLGNGSSDLFEFVARVLLGPGDNAVMSQHAFVVYPMVVNAMSAQVRQVPAVNYGHDLEAMAAAVDADTKVVFVANPNNPTGTWNTGAQLESFLAAVPERVLVVLDQAYQEYAQSDPNSSNYPDGVAWVGARDNLLVTRSFSKAQGLAGLRVGYGISSPGLAELLNRVRPPFNCNSLALAAALATLDDREHIARSCELNARGMVQVQAGLDELGLPWIASLGNFLAFDCRRDSRPLFDALLAKGIILRTIGVYEMPNHLRVSLGTEEENRCFLEALGEVLADPPTRV